MAAGGPSTKKRKFYKLTKDNYEAVLQMWVENENRDRVYIYHSTHLSEFKLETYAFECDIIIDIKNYGNSVLKTMEFKDEILDLC